ncbi:MAG: DUF551 domain-containing protein [Roseburia sp.]|nr:DUF551 domain-containing protein [Roseburia sp.]
MSIISEEVKALRNVAQAYSHNGIGLVLKHAADTIEELSAKLSAANMERSTAYYNNGWIPCSERLPEPGEIVIVYQEYSWERFEDAAVVTIGRLKPGNRQYWEFQYYRPDFRTGTVMDNDIICPGNEYVLAWQPLPAQYQPKGE